MRSDLGNLLKALGRLEDAKVSYSESVYTEFYYSIYRIVILKR